MSYEFQDAIFIDFDFRDRGFIKKCEKPPSASIELLTKELGGEFSDLKRENDSVGLSSTKEKFSPITLMAAQAKGIEVINKETSEYDILSLSSESEADAESSSRGTYCLYLSLMFVKRYCRALFRLVICVNMCSACV